MPLAPESNGAGGNRPGFKRVPPAPCPQPQGAWGQVHLHGFTPCPMLMEMMPLTRFRYISPLQLEFPWNFQGFLSRDGNVANALESLNT